MPAPSLSSAAMYSPPDSCGIPRRRRPAGTIAGMAEHPGWRIRVLAQITSGAVLGVDAYLVHVEVDLANGLPCMQVVGLPENAVREGRERVTAALSNAGLKVPPRRVTVNLAPADIRKEGSAFDLPVALGMLAANETITADALASTCVIGELGLDGTVRPVRGVLSIASRCRADGIRSLWCPPANAAEWMFT